MRNYDMQLSGHYPLRMAFEVFVLSLCLYLVVNCFANNVLCDFGLSLIKVHWQEATAFRNRALETLADVNHLIQFG